MRTTALVALLALVLMPLGVDGKPGRKRSKRRSNMPAGWTWPPSAAMKKAGKRCQARLRALGVTWKKARRTRKVATPIVVPDMRFGRIELVPIFRKPPFVMDCHLALALAEHSGALHALGVRQLRFSTIHDYRRVRKNGTRGRALSRHALGLAVDVYELVLDDGRTLVVEDHYDADRGVLAEIERAVNATGGFRTLLTPGSDPRSHYDHFHFAARMKKPG